MFILSFCMSNLQVLISELHTYYPVPIVQLPLQSSHLLYTLGYHTVHHRVCSAVCCILADELAANCNRHG